jgi:hypothetical protein
MRFEIPESSRAFMALAGKALHGALTPDEKQQFDQLLKAHPELKQQFADLATEIEESKFSELWERGLRVLLQCPQPEDKPYLESVKNSDREAWNEFLRGAFVLRVMAESMKTPPNPLFSNTLTSDEESELLAAVNAEQERRRQNRRRPEGR